MGKSLARGEGLLSYGALLHRRSPLYPLLIGAIYRLFGEHARLVLLAQCAFHAGTCWLVFDLGRRAFTLRTGIIAGVVCALHPMLIRYVADLHLETLFTFLLTLTLWLSVRFREQPSLRNGAYLGAAAALATLTKAVALLYPGLFAVGVVLASLREGLARAPWKALATTFLVMGLCIAPWTVRNYRVSGHLVPVSTGLSDAFLRGLVFSRLEFATLQRPPYTDAENEVNAWFRQLAHQAGTEWERDDWETDQLLNREMKRRIFAEPGEVIRKTVVGLFTFWYEMTSLTNSLIAGLLALAAWVFALIGCRRARSEHKTVWPFLLPVLYFDLLLAGLLALGRYSAPILPALLVVSAYGVDGLLSKRETARA